MFAAALAAGAALAAQDRQIPPESEGRTRTIFVTAIDDDGAPVLDLQPSDVAVREDGKSRDVLLVEPAEEMMQVALLVDDSGPFLNNIREGVAAFARALAGKAEIALISTGGRNTVLQDFTTQLDQFFRGIHQLVTRTTTGSYLLDGIMESSRVLGERRARRPVIVVLTLEGAEFSNVRADRVIEALRVNDITLHAVSVGKPTLKTMTAWNESPMQSIRENLDENNNRITVLSQGTRRAGGRLEQVLESSGIAPTMTRIARELASQLRVVYKRPEMPKAPTKLEVTSLRKTARIRARTLAPAR